MLKRLLHLILWRPLMMKASRASGHRGSAGAVAGQCRGLWQPAWVQRPDLFDPPDVLGEMVEVSASVIDGPGCPLWTPTGGTKAGNLRGQHDGGLSTKVQKL